jgi:L-ascorbate metabolism protein UlaG (beta-lactamase superfamily)
MEITWLGHSCFRIKSSHGVIITDPYPPEIGYILGKPTARIVTVSHQHPNHNYTQGIAGDQMMIVSRPGEYEISDMLILGITTFHDNEQGKKSGKNTVYLIDIDDVSVCHLGDLGHVLTSKEVEKLENIDVLFLPVGGQTTINATMAAEVVRQLTPKVVIPMHYKTPALKNVELDAIDNFLKEIGASNVTSQPKLNITKSSIPETMQIYLLDYPQAASNA